MTVFIEPFTGARLGSLISTPKGSTLSERQVEILEFCNMLSARVWCGYVAEELVCVWGLIPPSLLSNQAYLWMHATDAIKEHQFTFVRHSQLVMETMLEHHEQIVGHCRNGAADSIRWLKWLGAEFGPADGDIIPFAIRKRSRG